METASGSPLPASGSLAFAAVILAAGASSRMGRPKMLLAWSHTTIIGHLLEQWRHAGACQVAPICPPLPHPIHAELDHLGCSIEQRMINPEPARGMFSSIQAAAAWPGWAPGVTHWMLALGDQPQLQLSTLAALWAHVKADPARIWQPSHQGRRRHPVALPLAVFKRLVLSTSPTLREFLLDHAADLRSFECADPGLAVDLDTPEDYDRARPSRLAR